MSTTKPRILFTEDDPDTREMLFYLLRSEGYSVVCVESADEGLSLAKNEEFDLYLLDNWLPGLTGCELTKIIREFNKTTPILFYSGVADKAHIEEARLAGAQGYLVKPVNNDDLISEIRRFLAPPKPESNLHRVPLPNFMEIA